MFTSLRKPQTRLGSAFAMMEVIYHSIVQSVRSKHNNAFIAIGINMLQAIIFVMAFYLMFSVLGLRGAALRGDFMLYMMSGIFVFLTHIKSLSAVMGAAGPASAMMQHAPMNTIVSIMSTALATLYIQVLSMFLILFVYHVAFNPIIIDKPFPAFCMFVLAWFTGCALGLVLLALKPWFPTFVTIFATIYQRANMIASGKMFVANALPGYMLAMFDWNPLFHVIDQTRGFTFINYNPHYTSWEYSWWIGVVFVMLGLISEFYTRRHASVSWNARR